MNILKATELYFEWVNLVVVLVWDWIPFAPLCSLTHSRGVRQVLLRPLSGMLLRLRVEKQLCFQVKSKNSEAR